MNHICKGCARIKFKEHPKSVLDKKRGHYFITCSICNSCIDRLYRLDLINMRLSRINKHHSAYLNWGIPRIFCPYFEEQHYSTIDGRPQYTEKHKDARNSYECYNEDGEFICNICGGTGWTRAFYCQNITIRKIGQPIYKHMLFVSSFLPRDVFNIIIDFMNKL